MVLGALLGAIFSLLVGKIGRLSPNRLLLASLMGGLSCMALLRLPIWFLLPPPTRPGTQGLLQLFEHMVDLQWLFWWMLGGSLLPICLTFILGLTRSLSPLVIGLCSGLGLGLLGLSWMDYSPVPSVTGTLWRTGLGLQGMICIGCALATAGVQRIRNAEQPLRA